MTTRRRLITRGKSMLRKVIDRDRTFLDEDEQPLDNQSLVAVVLVHPRSGDRHTRAIAKVLLRKIAFT